MSEFVFDYDESLLGACAMSEYGSLSSGRSIEHLSRLFVDSGGVVPVGNDEACRTLFDLHGSHYGRIDDSSNEERVEVFVRNLVFVLEHNFRCVSMREEGQACHLVGLNQFSDRFEGELPLMEQPSMDWPGPDEGDSVFVKMQSALSKDGDADVVPLEMSLRHPSSLPLLSAELEMTLPQLTPLNKVSSKHKHHKAGKRKHKDDERGGVKELQVTNFQLSEQDSDFSSYLNWASETNPDGVTIVHPSSDQGACGSCWAFAATGTLEASTARNAAFEAYSNALQRNIDTNELQDIKDIALAAAKAAEQNALQIADLSVQELVDCDTGYDQGCTGGNPLLAYFFIHRFGLTSSSRYPYVAKQQTCQIEKVYQPIASVESWGVLTPNYEDNMELVLRYVGPIAVGINGAELSFLSYKQGIYDNQNCPQTANHALLIVGYGQEAKNGTKTKYWIARNSWGAGWGEQGYVKIARRDGQKGQQGVCGIAQNPSVALGGSLLSQSSQNAVLLSLSEEQDHFNAANNNKGEIGTFTLLFAMLLLVAFILAFVVVRKYRARKSSISRREKKSSAGESTNLIPNSTISYGSS